MQFTKLTLHEPVMTEQYTLFPALGFFEFVKLDELSILYDIKVSKINQIPVMQFLCKDKFMSR